MILGRNPALWLGAVAALLNVLVLVFGVALTADQLIALNAAAFALVALIANEADPTTVGTFALTTHPAAPPIPSWTTTAPASSPGTPSGPTTPTSQPGGPTTPTSPTGTAS